VDEDGKVIAEPVYQSVEPFDKHGLGVVENNDDLYGVIDKTGKLIIPCKYDGIDIWEKFIVVRKDGKKDDKYGIYSLDGKQLTAPVFDLLSDMNGVHLLHQSVKQSERIITTLEDGDSYLHGLLDENGNEICKPVFEDIEAFYDGIALARKKNGETCFINMDGKVIFEENNEWSIEGGFSEGVAPIKSQKDDKYHYIFNPNLDRKTLASIYRPFTDESVAHRHEHKDDNYVSLAYKHMEDKDYRNAIIYFTGALNNLQGEAHVLYNDRACCYTFLDDYKSAIRDLETALSLKPNYDFARKNLKICKKERNSRRWDNFFNVMSAVSTGMVQTATIMNNAYQTAPAGNSGASSGGYIQCRSCKGTGKCGTCNGDGYYNGSYAGTDNLKCPNCSASNGHICTVCNGTGKWKVN
jgi:tetratricopeptide (TPR) repeat protein